MTTFPGVTGRSFVDSPRRTSPQLQAHIPYSADSSFGASVDSVVASQEGTSPSEKGERKRRAKGRQTGGFILGLHTMISTPPTPGRAPVVRWSDDGAHFTILNIWAFMDAQQLCDSSEFPAFHRQLLAYGFRKINHASRGHDSNAEQPAFKHPSFRRDSTEDHLRRSKEKWKEEADPERLNSSMSEGTIQSRSSPITEVGLAERLMQLEREVMTSRQELKLVHEANGALHRELSAVKARNDALLLRVDELEHKHGGLFTLVNQMWHKVYAPSNQHSPAGSSTAAVDHPFPGSSGIWPNEAPSALSAAPSHSVQPPRLLDPPSYGYQGGPGGLTLSASPDAVHPRNDGFAPVQTPDGSNYSGDPSRYYT